MARREEKNGLALSTLLMNEGSIVLWNLIQHNLLGATIEHFLNKKKHKLFHFWKGNKCCDSKCKFDSTNPSKTFMFTSQWETLFLNNGQNCGSLYYCIHQFSANPNLTSSDLNISLSSILLLNIFSINQELIKLVKKLRTLRNSIVHSTCKKTIDDEEFEKKWLDISSLLLHIADNAQVSAGSYSDLRDRIAEWRCKNYESEVFRQTVEQYLVKVKEEDVLQV